MRHVSHVKTSQSHILLIDRHTGRFSFVKLKIEKTIADKYKRKKTGLRAPLNI